jgi:hypothetical protein
MACLLQYLIQLLQLTPPRVTRSTTPDIGSKFPSKGSNLIFFSNLLTDWYSIRSKLYGTVLSVNSQRGLSLFAFHTFFDVKSKFDQMKSTKVVRAALQHV